MRAAILLVPLFVSAAAAGDDRATPSAFRFARDPKVKASIDTKEVRRGVNKADPRDAIPAIRKPKHIPAKKATWLRDGDRVLGMVVGKEARAYPFLILQSHEMVNDVLGGIPVGPNY